MHPHQTRDEIRTQRFVSQPGGYVVELPQDRLDQKVPRAVSAEQYDALSGAWSDAVEHFRRHPGVTAAAAEDAAYAQLVDHVEDHGLAGTPLDPRDARWPTARLSA